MKNTQIEWIGRIPSDWDVKPISTCFKERNEKVSDYEWEPLSVTKQGIVKQLATAAKSDAHEARKKVCKNDFVINSRSDRKQSCGVSPYDGSVSLINIVLENRSLNPKFVNYLLKNYGFAEEFYRYGSGIVADLWSTNYQKMKKIMIPIPPKEKQQKIADFLDEKILEIDKIMENTKNIIDDYKSFKQSCIDEMTTKKINEKSINLEKKLENGWDVCKIKNIANIFGRIGFKGYTQSDFVGENEGAITLSPSNFCDMKMNYSKCSYISWDKYFESPEIMVKNGDILFVKTGSTYGKSCIVQDLPMESTINPQSIILKNIKINNKFLAYFLQSSFIKNQVEENVVGGTIPTLSQEKIKNFYVLIPSKKEQEEIVNFLKIKILKIDAIILQKEKLIDYLEEYKRALIYEYVTGKKEVI